MFGATDMIDARADPQPAANPASDTQATEALAAEASAAEALVSTQRTQMFLLLGIYLLIACFAMYFAAGLILPILVAILLKLVLTPLVRQLTRLRIPELIGAGIVLAVLTCTIADGADMCSRRRRRSG